MSLALNHSRVRSSDVLGAILRLKHIVLSIVLVPTELQASDRALECIHSIKALLGNSPILRTRKA